MEVGIIGYGEIGKSLAELYLKSEKFFNVKIKDINRDDGLHNCDIINISIPFNDNFKSIVGGYIMQYYNCKTFIIHSTVQVGTTKELQSKFSNHNICHSPVRGVHPNLYEGLITFPKYISCNRLKDSKVGNILEQHFQDLNITPIFVNDTNITEMLKLWSTTYYGVIIALHGEMAKMATEFNIPFEHFQKWNDQYNSGYAQLGKGNVVRPTLYAPEGGIGGHCVVPNTEILKEKMDSLVFDLIMQYKKQS